MEVEFEVRVCETGEQKSFPTFSNARDWMDKVKRTFYQWGGQVTFSCVKITREQIPIKEEGVI